MSKKNDNNMIYKGDEIFPSPQKNKYENLNYPFQLCLVPRIFLFCERGGGEFILMDKYNK